MDLLRVLLALAGMDAAAGLALLPYVPCLAPDAMPGKVTATTFALERPRCIFDPLANASDAIWLAVAFADASTTFKNPTSRTEVPPYEGLPTARAYMTLEMAAAAYGCSAPGAAVLRVSGDTACHGRAPCNGPLPSPGPYRVKFLLMGCGGPKAETKWSDPILLRRARSLSTIDPTPARRSSTAVIIAAILASLGAALAVAMLGAVGTQVCVLLCCRDLGAHLPYRTHHVPPALPHTLPPACICGCTPQPCGPWPTK